MLGANARAAVHLGIDVPRLIIVAFVISGALIGLAAATDIQGELAYMRADWNPAYGLAVVPLVFLARLNALALIPVALLLHDALGGRPVRGARGEATDATSCCCSWASCCCSWSARSTWATSCARGETVLGFGGQKGG